MSKKGAVVPVITNITYIILTIIVLAAVAFILAYFSSTTIDVAPIQANVLLYRSIYQPNALSYTDPTTGKVYPGLIESTQFTTEHLEKAFRYSYERQIMAKYEIILRNGRTQATAYYNKLWYERLEAIAMSGLPGLSGAKLYTKEMPIIYRSGVTDTPATLKITVIIPN